MRSNLDLWRSRSPWAVLEDVDNILSPFFQTAERQSFSPVSNVEEHGDHFLVSVDMPGLSKEDLNIEIIENTLTVSGERRRGDKFYGRFERSFSLPQNVESSKIEARYENGVLELAIPKAEEAKPRKIEIQTGEKEGFFGRLLNRTSQPQVKEVKGTDRAS